MPIKYINLAQNGDCEALEKITEDYKGLVYKTAHLFFLKGGDYYDLSQEGFIGLIKAIKTFNENKNTSFSTFANICIRGQIITAIKKSNSDKYKALNLNNESDEEIDLIIKNNYYSPENILLGKELIELLKIYLNNNLSFLERQVFLYLCKEYTYIEIAILLNEPPKKIDNTIQRIKKKIKHYLEKY